MERRRVTYLEVAHERPGRPGASPIVVDLDSWHHTPAAHFYSPPPRQRPACPAWLAQLALVGLIASGAVLDHVTIGPDEQAAIDRAGDRRSEVVDPTGAPWTPSSSTRHGRDLDRLVWTAAPLGGAPG